MQIGIIGAGQIGSALARHFVRLGHEVSMANSRGPDSLKELGTEIGATPGTLMEVITSKDLVVVAIPTKAVLDLPKDLFSKASSGTIVVDTGNYHPELRDGRIPEIDGGMLESEWFSAQISRPVIKAFNNILASSLAEKSAPKGASRRIALSVAGDSQEEKRVVMSLIDAIGFDPVDAGRLADSWRQQTGAPAYCRDLGFKELREALQRAEKNLIGEYRKKREADIKAMLGR